MYKHRLKIKVTLVSIKENRNFTTVAVVKKNIGWGSNIVYIRIYNNYLNSFEWNFGKQITLWISCNSSFYHELKHQMKNPYHNNSVVLHRYTGRVDQLLEGHHITYHEEN